MKPLATTLTKKELTSRNLLIAEAIGIINKQLPRFIYKHGLFGVLSEADIDDMRSDCLLSVCNAVDRFDPSRGVKFSTYITWRVIGSFKDFIKTESKIKEVVLDEVLMGVSVDNIFDELEEIIQFSPEKMVEYLRSIKLSEDVLQEIKVEIVNSVELESCDVIQHLNDMPAESLYLIVGSVFMNKSIKELSQELGYSENSGWAYRLKREALKTLQEKINKRS